MNTNRNTPRNRVLPAIYRDLEALRLQREHVEARKALLEGGKSKPGRERIVRAALRRYQGEYWELTEQIHLLEANIEGMLE